jgi:hypothetical protein
MPKPQVEIETATIVTAVIVPIMDSVQRYELNGVNLGAGWLRHRAEGGGYLYTAPDGSNATTRKPEGENGPLPFGLVNPGTSARGRANTGTANAEPEPEEHNE